MIKGQKMMNRIKYYDIGLHHYQWPALAGFRSTLLNKRSIVLYFLPTQSQKEHLNSVLSSSGINGIQKGKKV